MTRRRQKKEADIKVRVSAATKNRIVKLAIARGESESVIVREAIKQYLEKVAPDSSEAADPPGRAVKPGPSR